MKKNILFTFVILTSFQIKAQLYVKVSPAYNASLGGHILTREVSQNYNAVQDKFSEKLGNVRTSLGKGLMGNFAIGFNHTSQFSTEVGLSYLKGKSTETESAFDYPHGREESTFNYTGNMFSITPALVFYSKSRDSFRTYTSLGLSFNFISFDEEYDYTSSNGKRIVNSVVRYSGSVEIGLVTKLGIIARINESLELFGELAFSFANFTPNESETTLYTINGNDSLPSLTESERKWIYQEEYTENYIYVDDKWEQSYDKDLPRKRLSFDVPVSYLSVGVGLRFILFQKRNHIHKEESSPE